MNESSEGAKKNTVISVTKLDCRDGESKERAVVRATVSPELQAAITLQCWEHDSADINDLISELSEQTQAVQEKKLGRGEAMLTAQAHTLDAMFNTLSRTATENMNRAAVFESLLKVALRAQAQCRITWEALSAIQNPPLAGYVKQANIAHGHQQVNNASRTRENENEPNELLEDREYGPDQWMDQRAPAAAEGVDSAVQAVGAVDGTTDPEGQG